MIASGVPIRVVGEGDFMLRVDPTSIEHAMANEVAFVRAEQSAALRPT